MNHKLWSRNPSRLYGVDSIKLDTREIITLKIFVLGYNILQDFIVIDGISEEYI